MTNKLKYRQDFEVQLSGLVIKLTCYYQSTRTGFRHLCFRTRMCNDGEPSTKDCIAKACYVNRTWEEYPYQTVLSNALETIYKRRMSSQVSSAMKTIRKVD